MTTMNLFLSGLRSSALVVANDRRLLDCRDIGLPSDRLRFVEGCLPNQRLSGKWLSRPQQKNDLAFTHIGFDLLLDGPPRFPEALVP